MAHAPFVHLRIHSAYSLLDGSMQPSQIAAHCRLHRMPAAALTDRNNMFGAMEFSSVLTAAGVQPVIGLALSVARPAVEGAAGLAGVDRLTCDSLLLLAQNDEGYGNLLKLVSRAHLDVAPHAPAHCSPALLTELSGGLICLTGGVDGTLYRLLAAGQADAASAWLDMLVGAFPDRLYIELNRICDPGEAVADAALIDLAHARGLPLVATNPVQYESPAFHAAHDAMLCIGQSSYFEQTDRQTSNRHCWFKSPEDMAALFADVPEAIANTLVIAQRCAVAAPQRAPILPSFASDGKSEADVLRAMASEGLQARLETHVFAAGQDADARTQAALPYQERLDYELAVIAKMGFPGYFLIVADFIQWAKAQGIPVGPGRGSGAGSVVAWALKITDLDPLRFSLLFERFLNPERVSMPDFDIDFCETRREEVIRYVQHRYGRDHVAQIITFGTLKARAVIKDVGRVMQMHYPTIDQISKLIPNNPAKPHTLQQAIDEVRELRERQRDYPQLFDTALKLEGLYRHSSTHAAGVVIGDRPLEALVPLYRDPRSDMPVTQFDMKWVEVAGLVKFDFLGLKTLSVLQRAIDLLAGRGLTLDLARLPFDDPAAFDLLSRGDTVGVFQLESEGMRRTLAQVKPDKFEDIIALVALYRPGPMDNIPSFANRKQGREEPDYLHPLLRPILEETYGVIIYQEQVMQIAQVLAGYSLGEADLLRRAMGKKKQEEMDRQRTRFLAGAAERGVPENQASYIFELVNKFAGYGFNKSHAAAYALVAYQTAYLKANHPVEFYAASMAYDIHLTDKLAVFVDDMKRLGHPLLPPDINAAQADFSTERVADVANSPDGREVWAVRYALGGLKGVGEKAMAHLVEERVAGGPFRSIADFAARVDARLINKKQLDALACAGVFDSLIENRAAAAAVMPDVLRHASAVAQAQASAQDSLFGDAQEAVQADLQIPQTDPWPLPVRMARERDAFGFYFSAHPLDAFGHVLAAREVMTSAQVAAAQPPPGGSRRAVTMAGQIENVRWRQSQRGSRYLMADFTDTAGQFGASAFDDEAIAGLEAAHREASLVLLSAELMWRDGDDTPRITVRGVTLLEQLAERTRARLTIHGGPDIALQSLARVLDQRRGGAGQILLNVPAQAGITGARPRPHIATIALAGRYRVDADLRSALACLPGVEHVELEAAS